MGCPGHRSIWDGKKNTKFTHCLWYAKKKDDKNKASLTIHRLIWCFVSNPLALALVPHSPSFPPRILPSILGQQEVHQQRGHPRVPRCCLTCLAVLFVVAACFLFQE